MHFIRSLLVGAACLVTALAQNRIAFTQVPTSVEAGVPTTLKWAGGDGSLVTITLKQGPANNLQTVSIITGKATGNSFTWTPPKDLPNGDDYAFQIDQGSSEPNYSGKFTFSGGSGAAASITSIFASSSATSATASTSKAAASSQSVSSSKTAAASAISSALSAIASLNSTRVTTTVVPRNATTAILIGTAGSPIGTAIGTAISSGGTGIPISRNQTLSRATLTASRSQTTRTATASVLASTTEEATSTGSSGSSGSSRSSSVTPSPSGSGATNLASPLAFVISALVAVIYLG